ncbi:MAG: methyltransferase domain-containing protein [Candidatus Helarchaeota archaeon]|nr:methyltransferase domain-containing protein [Candidatus Helarchaeota archaeon]
MSHYFDNYKKQLNLLLDRNRTLKYKYAIFKAVKEGDVVIDFGCGTGVLGFFALQAGASHVYAIEETSIIEYARRMAIKNNLEENITFIQKPGKEITAEDISGEVDVILSEPVSNLLLEGDAWSSIEYLKQFLKNDGLVLPVSGSLLIVPVNAPPEVFRDSDYFLGGTNVYNIDFIELPRTVFYKSTLGESAWLTSPQPILEVNLLRDTLNDTFENSVKFSIQQSGQLVGVEFFFKLNIFKNITLSSRDQVTYHNWTPLFAPSSKQSSVCSGDILRITVSTEMISPYKAIWTLEFDHHSKLIPYNDAWWETDSAIPTLAPGVMLSKAGLLLLNQEDYSQYDCENDLEWDFIQLLPKPLNCNEMCQIIAQSRKHEMTFEEIKNRLIQLLHKLLMNSLINMPIPKERFVFTRFSSSIHIP